MAKSTNRAHNCRVQKYRTMMAVAAKFDMEILQFDVIGAFLNAKRDNMPLVICQLPDGYKKEGTCVKLNRALYGLKDSPVLWYQELSSTLTKLGLTTSKEEPYLFFDSDHTVFILFYVDDILVIFGRNFDHRAHSVIAGIKRAYDVEDKGPVSWFLGVRVIRHCTERRIVLCHDAYIDKVAKKFDLADST